MVPLFRMVFKVCYITSLMYWQQTRFLLQLLTPDFELLGERELLHNVLPKFGTCHLQLITLTFFNAFFIQSEVLSFPGFL